MIWIEALGWIAALGTLSAYGMRTMLAFRVAAVFANFFFLAYGYFADIPPTLFLHLILLPFNGWRLTELLIQNRRARAAIRGEADPVAWLEPLLKPLKTPEDGYVFRRGDAPDRLYLIKSGQVELEEIGLTLEAGEIFGEIAFFTAQKARTTSARCIGDCEILWIDEAGFMRVYHQHPAFSLYIVRLVAERLIDGTRRRPELYAPT
jgi:hypothetical protein